jgi:hypothetical protein
VEAGSVPLVEAAGNLPLENARISGTPLPSQTGISFESPTLPESSPDEGIDDTSLPPQPGGSFENPTLSGGSLGGNWLNQRG